MPAIYPLKSYSAPMPYYKVASWSQIAFDSYIVAFYRCHKAKEFEHYLAIAKDDSDLEDRDYVRLWTIAHNMIDLLYERVYIDGRK